MNCYFVPFTQLRQQPTIVVDSVGLGAVLTLAHWRGAATPVFLRDDTSAGAALRALRHTPRRGWRQRSLRPIILISTDSLVCGAC